VRVLSGFGKSNHPVIQGNWGQIEIYYLLRGNTQMADSIAVRRVAMGVNYAPGYQVCLEAIRAALKGDKETVVARASVETSSTALLFSNVWSLAKVGAKDAEDLAGWVFEGAGGYPWIHAEMTHL